MNYLNGCIIFEYKLIIMRVMWIRIYLLAALIWLNICPVAAQPPQLLRQLPGRDIRRFSVDELNNVYLVDKKNGITKYNAEGDSVAFFQQISLGPVGAMDVTDPMRILVYYPNFLQVVMLDRMMAPLNHVDLKMLGIRQPTAVAVSRDGSFWVYDYLQVKLIKLDRQYKNVAQSNDLRILLNEVPKFEMMFEKDNELWAYDKDKGLFIFNRFGDFLSKIELPSATAVLNIRKEQDQVIYTSADLISVYNLKDLTLKTLDVMQVTGEKPRAVWITKDHLYVLGPGGLNIYNVTY